MYAAPREQLAKPQRTPYREVSGSYPPRSVVVPHRCLPRPAILRAQTHDHLASPALPTDGSSSAAMLKPVNIQTGLLRPLVSRA